MSQEIGSLLYSDKLFRVGLSIVIEFLRTYLTFQIDLIDLFILNVSIINNG